MTKQTPKEVDDLKLLWEDQVLMTFEEQSNHDGKYIFYKNNEEFILYFWHLKAKINNMKKQICQFTDQVNKLTK